MLPPPADRPKLTTVLELLSGAVEELLLGGLTTASESTRQTLDVAMQEAARFRLLRLGSSLRAAAEELGRFHRQDPAFSRRRLTFFLSRSWLLGRGISHALQTGDEKEYDRLTWSPATRPLPARRGRLPRGGQEGGGRVVRGVRLPAPGDGRCRPGRGRASG